MTEQAKSSKSELPTRISRPLSLRRFNGVCPVYCARALTEQAVFILFIANFYAGLPGWWCPRRRSFCTVAVGNGLILNNFIGHYD
jgi:hypothetical protein